MGNLIHRGKGSFTHVENTVFYDRTLSLKAKGAYCQIRSLEGNPEWVFTVKGFVSLVRDGKDAVTAALRELEHKGYIIRARKRDDNGKFGCSEDAVWVTLDDPDMYAAVVAELKDEGFSVISQSAGSAREPASSAADLAADGLAGADKPQVGTRSGFSACGFSASGKPSCGESAAINSLDNQGLNESIAPFLPAGVNLHEEGKGSHYSEDDRPVSSGDPQAASPSTGCPAKVGEIFECDSPVAGYEDGFRELCDVSLRAVRSQRFKGDCYREWCRRMEEGYTSEQILEAYRRYSDSYRRRNGENLKCAKSLARWLIDDDGLVAFAGDPRRCLMTHEDGSPLSMEELASVYRRFGRLWNKAKARRVLVLSGAADGRSDVSDDEFREALQGDVAYQLFMDACRMSYSEYLFAVDPRNEYGLREADELSPGESLLRLVKNRDEIERMYADDPEFERLVDTYTEMAAETTRARLVGVYDDKAWEAKRYEELKVLRQIEEYRAEKNGHAGAN